MSRWARVLMPKVRRKIVSSSRGGVKIRLEQVQILIFHLFIYLSPSKWEAPIILLRCLPYLGLSDLQADFLWV